jgi:hypothetical protein
VALAWGWGLAEATFFFLVPDVYLTFVALRSLRAGLKAAAAASAGALIGGSLLYFWGLCSPQLALRFLSHVPGIHDPLIARVGTELEARGLVAMLQGPLQGTPYKIYAVQWGILHGSWGSFLLVSVPARAGRFLLSVLVPFALRRFVRPWILACAWTAFYIYYFWTFGW